MIRRFLVLLGVILCKGTYAQYDITVKIDGLTCGDELLLANHFGDKQYLIDTSLCIDGTFHFTGDTTLASGVYLVVLPKKKFFEILISSNEDQMKYTFSTDTTLIPSLMKTSGSMENDLFFEFNRFAAWKSLLASNFSKKIELEENEKKKESRKKDLGNISKSVAAKRNEISSSHSGLFISKLYTAMREVVPADAPEGLSEEEGQMFQYLWVRDHYWDNIDLSEDGLVRSPVFHGRLTDYFSTFMSPNADTAIMMGDNLINKIQAAGSKEQYKYTIHYLLGHFESTKYICFDKALWHMAKNYYCAGKAYWCDSAYIAKMCEASADMEPALCDSKAGDINMPDTNFTKKISMYAIDKPVTVVVFWDINCGTCKKELPIISRIYDSMTNKNFEIYAVYTKGEWDNWKERVRDEKYNFINVTNAFGDDPYRGNYHITTVPQIFILDRDKNIRFKKIGAEDIPGFVQYLLEEQGIIEPEKEEKIKEG
jgi:thiol-disulfide isomerase/thioredoxin